MMSIFYLIPAAFVLVFFWVRECRRFSPPVQSILFLVLLPMALVPVWEIESFDSLNWNQRAGRELKAFMGSSAYALKDESLGDERSRLRLVKEEASRVSGRGGLERQGGAVPMAVALLSGLAFLALTLLLCRRNAPRVSMGSGVACIVCLSVFLSLLSSRMLERRYERLLLEGKGSLLGAVERSLGRGDAAIAVSGRLSKANSEFASSYGHEPDLAKAVSVVEGAGGD